MIKISNPSQKLIASSKAPSQDLKDMDVLCTFKFKIKSQNFGTWVQQSRCETLVRNLPHPPKAKSRLERHGSSLHLKNLERAKFQNMVVSKTGDHIQIKIQLPNPSHKPSTSSKTQTQALKDRDVLYTFKIKIKCPNLEHGHFKDQ